MHQVRHNAEIVAAVAEVCSFAYGVARRSAEITMEAIEAGVGGTPRAVLDEAVDALDQSRLLRRRDADRIFLNATGKRAFEEDCVPELVFGEDFVIAKYGPAVAHVIVKTRQGDEHGATGFMIEEPVRGIATAKHVLQGNELLRVNARDRTQVCGPRAEIVLGPDGVDLAIIRAEIPAGVVPLRAELHDQGAVDLEPVLVLGYPPIAGHEPTLIPVSAQATAGVPLFGGGGHSLLLQRMTTPGFSGGPVLDRRGRVIGVVREEGGLDRGQGAAVFIFGTPACYLVRLCA
jgi:S1-C subfamily serine protease